MQPVRVLFFGSTGDSVLVLRRLMDITGVSVRAAITQPPRPVGRQNVVTPTPIELFAKAHDIPVLSFPSDPIHPNRYLDGATVVNTLAPFKAELLVSASYGQKIPSETIAHAAYGGLNVHPSLLPRWRGADPVPWAILSGDRQIGVSVVTLSDRFDSGMIIAQKKIPITNKDFSDPLRTKLFMLGADLLAGTLTDYISGKNKGVQQNVAGAPVSKRFFREDGFEPWETLQKAFTNPEEAVRLDRKFRALMPWPGLWTTVPVPPAGDKRLKIISCHLSPDSRLVPDSVQVEGKKPVSYAQFTAAYTAS